jgi:hypothetical protein
MDHDGQDAYDDDFLNWLKKHKLQAYFSAFEDEGYDDLASLALLSEEEVEEFATSIDMKKGHKKKLPVVIQELREDMQELKGKRTREEAKREREEARKEEELEEKRKRDKEIADIEAEKELDEARSQRARRQRDQQRDEQQESELKTSDLKHTPSTVTENLPSKAQSTQSKTKPTDLFDLPANKIYSAFISHKKVPLMSIYFPLDLTNFSPRHRLTQSMATLPKVFHEA